jgi:hypothetical protein
MQNIYASYVPQTHTVPCIGRLFVAVCAGSWFANGLPPLSVAGGTSLPAATCSVCADVWMTPYDTAQMLICVCFGAAVQLIVPAASLWNLTL